MRTLFTLPAAIALLALGSITHPAAAGWSQDPFTNNPVCTATGDQSGPRMIANAGGGATIVWADTRNGNFDLYAQRIDDEATPLWTPNGVAISLATDSQFGARIVPDGTDGAIVAWADRRSGAFDIYAQRVDGSGAALWAVNGVPLCTATGDQGGPTLIPDGSGGAVVAWQDSRSGGNDIYAQRVDASGAPLWTPDGVALCTAPNSQSSPVIVADGAGGAIVMWLDYRSGTHFDIYAQHVSPSGTPQWTADGSFVSASGSSTSGFNAVSDGAGGAVVVVSDNRLATELDVFAQRVSASGTPLWPANQVVGWVPGSGVPAYGSQLIPDGNGGAIVVFHYVGGQFEIGATRIGGAGNVVVGPLTISSHPSPQHTPSIVSDGSGGVIIAYSAGGVDFGSQRLNSTLVQQWGALGLPFTLAIGTQSGAAIASDGAGGAILVWQDSRNAATGTDIYAQRIDHFGFYPDARPAIASVHDVANDQGGKLRVSWTASYLDADPDYAIAEYRIWRSVPDAAAAQALRSGDARLLAEGEAPAGRPGRIIDTSVEAGQTIYWEYVGSQVASGDPAYQYTVPTTSDSTPDSNPYTKVRVQARHTNGTAFWNSEPDSGYSVDNLPPSAPASFTAVAGEGGAQLAWAPSAEPDFDRYRLYRGGGENFVPGPGTLIAEQSTTGFVDAEPASFYKLSAVDAHGNESPFAAASPGVLDAPAATPRALALARPSPNPAGNDVVFGFTLPRGGPVALDVFDAGGRRVRALRAGTFTPGAQALRFDLRDDGGRMLGSGLYFVRLRADGRTLSRSFVVMR